MLAVLRRSMQRVCETDIPVIVRTVNVAPFEQCRSGGKPLLSNLPRPKLEAFTSRCKNKRVTA